MFSGIVEEKGQIVALKPEGNIVTMTVEVPKFVQNVKENDSISVDGVCLTVVSKNSTKIQFQVVPRTWELSTLGLKQVGDWVNLERSLSIQSFVGGHLVQGHVDCQGKIVSAEEGGETRELVIEIPDDFRPFVVPRGSVAVDGISFTVADCQKNRFQIAVIPHTLKQTTIRDRKVGSFVNIEFDVIGKYVVNTLEHWKGVNYE